MSVAATNWAWRQQLQPAPKLVLMALADYADDKARAWPDQATLAAKACMDQRTVRRHLDRLAGEGYLRIERKRGPDGKNRVNVYHLRITTELPLEGPAGNLPGGPDPEGDLSYGGPADDLPAGQASSPHGGGSEPEPESPAGNLPAGGQPEDNPEDNPEGSVVRGSVMGIRYGEPGSADARAPASGDDQVPATTQEWTQVWMMELGYSFVEVQTPKNLGIFRDWVAQGVTVGEVRTAHQMAVDRGKTHPPPAYVAPIVEDLRRRPAPAHTGGAIHHGTDDQAWGGDL